METLLGFFRGSSGVPEGDMRRSIKFTAANRTTLQFIRFVTCVFLGRGGGGGGSSGNERCQLGRASSGRFLRLR